MHIKRKYDEIAEEDISLKQYGKRMRRSKSSCYTNHKSRNLNRNGSVKISSIGSSLSTCLSHPTRWSRQKPNRQKRNRCTCQRHSDSGFCTKSLRSRKHGSKCSRKIKRDEEGHLVYVEGDLLNNRYELVRTLGQGTFGKVVLAKDLERDGRRVAIKIVRRDKQDYEDAMIETDIITLLQKQENDNNLCINLYESFDYHEHLCIVFELLGHSIYEFMRRNQFQPFTLTDIQKIGHQLCRAVKFCHDNGLVHTDLKPENILFVRSDFDLEESGETKSRLLFRQIRSCELRLIDFGSAVFEKDHGRGIISTRHYRAPEVILELGWSYSSDVWSIGCILFELYTGDTLFQTHDTMEHLAMMERTLGPLPSSMIQKSRKKGYFRHGRLDWDERSSSGRLVRHNCRPLKTHRNSKSTKVCELFDLMEGMLEYRPKKRLTLDEALKHPFFESE